MTVELSRFDWAAVGAIGQVLAALATLGSLWFLWRQIRLTRAQVDQSGQQLKIALEQMVEASRRAEEARHEAVIPEISLGSKGSTSDQEQARLSYYLSNLGAGPAHLISWRYGSFTSSTIRTGTVGDIPAGGHCEFTLALPRRASGELVFTWSGRFGREYSKRWWIEDDGVQIQTIMIEPDGRKGPKI